MNPDSTTLVPIGTAVRPYGSVQAVGLIQGERYYWLIDKQGIVSMMPADDIERRAREQEAFK